MHLAGPHSAAPRVPRLRRDRRRADSLRRREHLHHRRQRRDEPRRRRRRPARLVPQAAPRVRHHLPHHQPDRAAADRDHPAEPRRCLSAGRSLRVRRGVELLPEIAGRAGAALPPPRPGIQDPRQLPHRGPRDSGRPDRHHPGSVPGGHRQPVLQADRHHLRCRVHARPLRDLHDLRTHQPPQDWPNKKAGLEEFNLDMQAGDQPPTPCTRAPAACWWPSATTPACRTCKACCTRPTCAATTSW